MMWQNLPFSQYMTVVSMRDCVFPSLTENFSEPLRNLFPTVTEFVSDRDGNLFVTAGAVV